MTTLLVPMYLDALYLPSRTNVLEEMTDYTKLPYYKGSTLMKPGNAYISETVLSPPFQQSQLTLEAGIHLHWSLPDALTNGIAREGQSGITFPLVPNRWLIIRRRGNLAEKKWVVESDYLYPEGATPKDTINILYYPATNEYQPYRFLGRKLELGQWRSRTTDAQYIKELSAIGPFARVDSLDNEKVAFAGFYPNCRSVFGFHDGEITTTPANNLRYDVIGWYSDSNKDYLEKFIQEQSQETNPQGLLDILQSKAGWTVEIGNNQSFPRRVLCHASLKFTPNASLTKPETKKYQGKIAVGNTQEEAIAAYLARQLDSKIENRKILEEQLEALQMSGRLMQQNLDFGPKFQDALHEDSFTSRSREVLWQVVPEGNAKVSASGNAQPANAVQGEANIQVTLSASIGDKLSEVNQSQREYDQKLAKIGSIREQVYADWYKYMLASYVTRTGLLDRSKIDTLLALQGLTSNQLSAIKRASDMDLIKSFIDGKPENNQYGLKALENEIKSTGVLTLGRNKEGEVTSASAPASFQNYSFDSNSSAARLAKSIEELIAELKRFNKESRLIAPKKSVKGDSTLEDDDIATKCLSFNGNQDYEISDLGNIQAISMWVNIPTGAQGSLLDVKGSGLANLHVNSSSGIGSNWQKIYINGQQVNGQVSWTAIPKNGWVFLYLEAKNAFNGITYLMSNSSHTNRLQGRIASVSFYKKPLSPAQIDQNCRDKIGLLRPSYSIKIVPGPRYWQPSDPVLLMTGEVVKPTRNRDDERSREDGFLQCQLLTKTIDLQTLPESGTLNVFDELLNQFVSKPTEKIGFREWKDQPWNPFLLEWQVQLKALNHTRESTKYDQSTNYPPDIIKNNYQLRVNGIDITPTSASGFADYPSIYSGASFLSPSASMLLKNNLIDYLKRYLLPDYYQEKNISLDNQTEDFLVKNFEAVKAWYYQKNPTANAPIYTALRAYEQLQSLNGCLAQSLGGFSDALLTYNRTFQLDVNDNLLPSSGPSVNFLGDVKNALGRSAHLVPDSILRSPLLRFAFSPIRVGGLKISSLRLVDTFGRVNMLLDSDNRPEIVTSQPLTLPSNLANVLSTHPIYLAPRLAQPARLNFRWLSATQKPGTRSARKQEEEMSGVPSTNPICGWILPNNLDNSLTIYDDQGDALVMIDRTAKLRSIPGRDYSPQEIQQMIEKTNPYLKQMVSYLIAQGAQFFTDFLTTVNKSLETIDPEGFAQNKAISLLVARPLALVRSRINLDVQGIPAVSQNRTSFSEDIFGNKVRTTDAFEKVKFPIRIGEYQQFNDGVVGYWIEKKDSTYTDGIFYAPQSCYVPHPQIKTLFNNATDTTPNNPLNLEQTLEENTAQTLVMLIDPRGKVNATCGILPAKTISIPPEQYVPALQAIEITFLAAPLLSDLEPINDLDQIKLSLAEVPGYEWSWLGKNGVIWSNRPLVPFDSESVFSSPQKIYDGWLKLSTREETNE